MTVYLGRNMRMYKGSTVVAYGKNLKVTASAEIIKEYSMDSVSPALTGAGKQTYTWSISKLYEGTPTLLADLIAGTKFTITFSLAGSSTTAPYTTLSNCTILNWNKTAGETGGVLLDVSGEAETMAETVT